MNLNTLYGIEKMTPAVKGKLLITSGWIIIGVGAYLVMVGSSYDEDGIFSKRRPTNDIIIDAEWSEVL